MTRQLLEVSAAAGMMKMTAMTRKEEEEEGNIGAAVVEEMGADNH